MNISYTSIGLKRRHPLRTARGESPETRNLFVRIEKQDTVGIGEAAPNLMAGTTSTAECQRQIEEYVNRGGINVLEPDQDGNPASANGLAPCARAALNMARWDLAARQSGMPLYRLLGLQRVSPATSVTVSILPLDEVHERVIELLERTGVPYLKIKSGSPEGIEADQAMLAKVIESVSGRNIGVRVDANGGWDLDQARSMMRWLSKRSVELVEQPLARGCEDQLPELFRQRSLPLFVDESCMFSEDIPALAESVDGINIKLMKCGGITEALRMLKTARRLGLKTMLGCMCESSLSISAAASLASLADYIDLDSHLNLLNDPAQGTVLDRGVVLPGDSSGLGAKIGWKR